ncbi:MAG: hypothetical protein AB7O39_10515 [Flavobacteriaceae bacterium]
MPSEETRSSYRRTLQCVALAAAAVVVAFAGLALALRGHARSPEALVHRIADIKAEAAAAMTSPKLILVSGSGGLFGIRADMISKRIGMPAVNAGLHGALGAAYIAYYGASLARPGDVVLIAIEDPLYTRNELVTAEAVHLSWARGDRFFETLSWPQRFDYFRGVSLSFVWALVRNSIKPPPLRAGNWRLSMMSAFGDFDTGPSTMRSARELTQNRALDEMAFARRDLPYELDRFEITTGAVRDTILSLEHKGVRVIATWGALLDAPLYDRAFGNIRRALPAFYETAGVQFIRPQGEARLSEAQAFDTVFHANSDGAVVRTARLIEALCQQTDICRETVERDERGLE